MLKITHQENANKTTLRHHIESVRMGFYQKYEIISFGECMEEREHLVVLGENVN